MDKPTTTFVCGATGTQGGALASFLLSRALPVHCMARDPSSAAAQSLASRGAKVHPGSYDDLDALAEALTGCTTAYMNFMPDFTDHTAELRWARAILRIAGEKGVKQVVYSSSLGLDDPLSLPGVEEGTFTANVLLSKKSIENEVRAAEHVPTWTIFRPGWFMANLLNPFAQMMAPGLLSPSGTWTVGFVPSTRLPTIDTETMGRFTCEAVLDPARFHGHTIGYCDELLSPDEIVDRLKKATGRHELSVQYLAEEDIQAQIETNPFLHGQYCSRAVGDMVNMDEVKGWGIELGSLEKFLDREKSRVAETYNVN